MCLLVTDGSTCQLKKDDYSDRQYALFCLFLNLIESDLNVHVLCFYDSLGLLKLHIDKTGHNAGDQQNGSYKGHIYNQS